MVIDTTEECSCRILPNELNYKVGSPRMLLNEIGHVVNKAGNKDKRPLCRLLMIYVLFLEQTTGATDETHSFSN